MRVLGLKIRGFRGIAQADLLFGKNTVLVGPSGAGKSSIIDALSLVFARNRLVRAPTEHDFFGSTPTAATRVQIVATLGFSESDPRDKPKWFRTDRAVPKWWNATTQRAVPSPQSSDDLLCAQIGFAARFDLEHLEVEQMRYFHDDDSVVDPFVEDAVNLVPTSLLNDIGYYVLPARRTWEAAATFSSELFRRVVADNSGIPGEAILQQRDELRTPTKPLEEVASMQPLLERLNAHLATLLPSRPRFQLRVTGGDVQSLLEALTAHYQDDSTRSLPVSRHGVGLLSLQTFILLLETGRSRRERGLPFLFAVEEPELHAPPAMQRRLMGLAAAVADQTICTTHAPKVAAAHDATSTIVLERRSGTLYATPLLQAPLSPAAPNALRRLYVDERARVVEALMCQRILVPEGKNDYEWLRLLVDIEDTAAFSSTEGTGAAAPFGSVVGVVPTPSANVELTFEHLARVRANAILVLVDGDGAGDQYIQALLRATPPPYAILQWPQDWEIEDVIGWILQPGQTEILRELEGQLDPAAHDVPSLIARLKTDDKNVPGHLKGDVLTYERIASAIRSVAPCASRTTTVLDALARAALGMFDSANLVSDNRSNSACTVVRFDL